MTLTIRCVLLDDELHSLEYLKLLCSRMEAVEVVKCFSDPLRLLAAKDELLFDACLIDIDMPSLNGLQVAQLLEHKHIIFTTAHSQYAAEAFDLEAVDFVRKPIQKGRLEKAFARVREKMATHSSPSDFHTFNTEKGKTLIHFADMLYITTEAEEKRDKLLYLQNGQVYTLKNITLEKLLSILPARHFFQVNKRDIVSMQAVHVVHHDEIVLKNTTGNRPICVTLGPKYRETFIKALHP